MKLKIGSLFTGVGGLELELLKSDKFELTYVADPDKWCSAVLAYQHPMIPNYGSVTKINPDNLPDVDIMIAGTNCQNFSLQGDKKGLEGDKSKLFYDFARLVRAKQPKYALWENVAGASMHRDFQVVQQIFKEIGYEIDYDIFNAREYAGTIQQRKRVFLLATSKDCDQVRLNRTIPDNQFSDEQCSVEMQSLERRLVSVSKSHREKHVDVRINEGIANTLVTGWGCSGMSTKNYSKLSSGRLRELTVNECEALMTWPKDWTKTGVDPDSGALIEIPKRQRYKMCGNGVVSQIVPHILKDLK